MATAVDAAILEIEAKLAELAPELEGLKDYERLNLNPPTLSEVRQSIALYETRVALLLAALEALKALQAHGHPDIPVREIPPQSFDDLVANLTTIEAALAKFSAGTAIVMGLAGGTPELKDPQPPTP